MRHIVRALSHKIVCCCPSMCSRVLVEVVLGPRGEWISDRDMLFFG